MSWSHLTVPGGEIEVFEPSTPLGSAGLLFLPGHSGKTLAQSTSWTASLEQSGLRAACPLTGNGWWLDAANPIGDRTPLEWLHHDVATVLRSEWDTGPTGLAVAGVSLGGQAALGLAYRHSRDYPVVAAVSPTIDFHKLYGLGLPLDDWYQSAEEARQQTVPLQLNPLAWPTHQLLTCDTDDGDWYEGVERLAGKLASSGIPRTTAFESHRLGHCWDYFDTTADPVLAFITQRLEQNRRTLFPG